MNVLVVNAGSSSLKYQLLDTDTREVFAKGNCERIGSDMGIFGHSENGGAKQTEEVSFPDHRSAIARVLEELEKTDFTIDGIGHRIVQGGWHFDDSAVVDDEVMAKILEVAPLAPLHNYGEAAAIEYCREKYPELPNVAVFDTSFHQTMPPKNFMYALPYRYYDQYRVRRYGFHGTSHKYVAQMACRLTGVDYGHSKIVTCHIGSGASVTAILDGKSYDTSMGFTPVDGLIMGTRCGSTDPGALIYIAEKEGLNLDRLSGMINKESGMLGITNVSSDMRDIRAAAENGNARAQLAIEMFAARIKKFVGSYAALMEGIDLLVFTGGIGENDPTTRELVCQGLEFMGIRFDFQLNKQVHGEDTLLSTPDSKVKVAVIATNEELVIASDTFRLTKKRSE